MRFERHPIPLGFCDDTPLCGSHVCYIYSDEEERQKVTSKFMAAGLQNNERVLCVTDTLSADELVEQMVEHGLDLRDDACSTIQTSAEVYYPDGHFSPDRMLAKTRDFFTEAVSAGHRGARGTGKMDWVVRKLDSDYLALEYEAKLTTLIEEYPYTPLCQYDARKFSGDFLMKVLQVHPYMVVHGQLMQNPYFIEPATFLADHLSHAS